MVPEVQLLRHSLALGQLDDKGYEAQRSARDEYNQVKLSFGDEGYIQYLETSTIR